MAVITAKNKLIIYSRNVDTLDADYFLGDSVIGRCNLIKDFGIFIDTLTTFAGGLRPYSAN